MPMSLFFATQADLAPGLEALQKERSLQYVRCRRGGLIDTPALPTFTSLLDATDLDHLQFRSPMSRDIDRSDLTVFYVLDADAPISVEESLIGSALPGGGTIRYHATVPEGVPYVLLTPGGLYSSPPVLWCGELQAEYGNADEIRLYRQIVNNLFKGFRRSGGYFYGPESLALGTKGVRYAYMTRGPYKPWTYEEVIQGEQEEPPLPAKPEQGRLSLEESWSWLEIYGYEMPRNVDGSPRLYRRQPKSDDSPDQGFNFFRTSIDEEEFDRLTIPRTYIGKSGAYETTFRRSDLSGSRFAADDFAYCDFTEADLSHSYLVAGFIGCRFDRAVLTKADLRWSTFEDCTFESTIITDTKLLKEQAQQIPLSEKQRAEIAWYKDAGPTPREW